MEQLELYNPIRRRGLSEARRASCNPTTAQKFPGPAPLAFATKASIRTARLLRVCHREPAILILEAVRTSLLLQDESAPPTEKPR
ncbi:hypothetical protein BH23GEM8_BH23GEM8_16990 [soil metagenome]